MSSLVELENLKCLVLPRPDRKDSKKMTRFDTPEASFSTPAPVVPASVDIEICQWGAYHQFWGCVLL